jgi:hypothetical protein
MAQARKISFSIFLEIFSNSLKTDFFLLHRWQPSKFTLLVDSPVSGAKYGLDQFGLSGSRSFVR